MFQQLDFVKIITHDPAS